MNRDLEQLLGDTLFNPNVRPSTRQTVLLSALKKLGISPLPFQESLDIESGNAKNITDDQRERDRNPLDEQLGLKDKELRLLQGKGL